MDLHSRKNADYAGTGRPLGNFERVSKALEAYGITPSSPAAVALVYMMKQVDAVMYAVGQGRTLDVESVGDRLRDIAVYAVLTKIMLEETKGQDAVISTLNPKTERLDYIVPGFRFVQGLKEMNNE